MYIIVWHKAAVEPKYITVLRMKPKQEMFLTKYGTASVRIVIIRWSDDAFEKYNWRIMLDICGGVDEKENISRLDST